MVLKKQQQQPQRKKPEPWTRTQVSYLALGVQMFGLSAWAKIKDKFGNHIGERGPYGYRDKWRSLREPKGVAARETYQLAISDAEDLKIKLNL